MDHYLNNGDSKSEKKYELRSKHSSEMERKAMEAEWASIKYKQVEFMKDKIASTENIATAIWDELEPRIRALGIELHSIRIEETENNFVEYFGN